MHILALQNKIKSITFFALFNSTNPLDFMKKITKTICVATASSLFILHLLTGCSKSVTDNQNEAISPTITAIRPTSAKSGDTVTVFGKNLPLDKSSTTITINEKPLNIILQTKDSLEFTVPQSVGSGPVTINAAGASFVGPEFTYDWKVIVTTVAGTGEVGNQNGPSYQASFYCPWASCVIQTATFILRILIIV